MLERAEQRRTRAPNPWSSLLLRWRLRSWRSADTAVVAELADAVRQAVADPEIWRIRTEDEILDRYMKRGL
jgi:hypothetical protein